MTLRRSIGIAFLVLLGHASSSFAQISKSLTSTTCPGTGCLVISAFGNGSVGVQISGTFAGVTVLFEQSNNGTTWETWAVFPNGSTTTVTTANTTGLWVGNSKGINQVRVRLSVYGSGSVDVSGIVTLAGLDTATGSAPSTAAYITQTPDSVLTNEQALSLLSTGLVTVTTTTGVLSSVPAPSGAVVGTTDSQVLSGKTLTTPTIASFTNATHNHSNAAGGGQLTEAAFTFSDITTGNASSSAHGFLPKTSGNIFDFFRGDGTFGHTLPRGTIVANDPFSVTQTWNNAAITFQGIVVDITQTAANGASSLFSVRRAGVDVFRCTTNDGGCRVAGDINSTVNMTMGDTGFNQTTTRGYWHSPSNRDFAIGSNGSSGVELTFKVGAAPTLGADCGTGATRSATNAVGRVTIGTAPGGTCTVTFSQAFTTNAPACWATNESSAVLLPAVATTTALTITGVFIAGNTVTFFCPGWQ